MIGKCFNFNDQIMVKEKSIKFFFAKPFTHENTLTQIKSNIITYFSAVIIVKNLTKPKYNECV